MVRGPKITAEVELRSRRELAAQMRDTHRSPGSFRHAPGGRCRFEEPVYVEERMGSPDSDCVPSLLLSTAKSPARPAHPLWKSLLLESLRCCRPLVESLSVAAASSHKVYELGNG